MKKNKLIPINSEKSKNLNFENNRKFRFSWNLPFQLQMICKLLGVAPEKLLKDFAENLDHGAWNREGRSRAKEFLVNYFLEMGYGQNRFSVEEIRNIFSELDAVGNLFPQTGDKSLLDLHTRWRTKYYEYWFEKWNRVSK